jgi:hypothetical protein
VPATGLPSASVQVKLAAVECLFCWYWIADLCAEEGIEFVLGHALEMKAIHGGKTKNDRIDSYKIARVEEFQDRLFVAHLQLGIEVVP